jgi:hypothetical protein
MVHTLLQTAAVATVWLSLLCGCAVQLLLLTTKCFLQLPQLCISVCKLRAQLPQLFIPVCKLRAQAGILPLQDPFPDCCSSSGCCC